MRVLLDEDLPRILRQPLVGHEVWTVQRMGWAGVRNGELLRRAAAAGFDALVTADRSLEHQQNVAKSALAVIVLRLKSTRIEHVLPLAPGILEALERAERGRAIHVDGKASL